MKTLNLAVVVSSVVLLVSGVAQAEDTYRKDVNSQNFTSKRPYQQALPDSAYQKDDNWEGATLVDGVDERSLNKDSAHKRMNLNSLGKRPYMEKASD